MSQSGCSCAGLGDFLAALHTLVVVLTLLGELLLTFLSVSYVLCPVSCSIAGDVRLLFLVSPSLSFLLPVRLLLCENHCVQYTHPCIHRSCDRPVNSAFTARSRSWETRRKVGGGPITGHYVHLMT